MEVYLRLLKEKHLSIVRTEYLSQDRQYLAHSIPHVDQITSPSCFVNTAYSDLQLERSSSHVIKLLYSYFMEQAGRFSESFQAVLQFIPLVLFPKVDIRKISR